MGRAQNTTVGDAFTAVIGTRRGADRPEEGKARTLNPWSVRVRLQQDRTWRSQDGQIWQLEDMKLTHVRRLIAMLNRQADSLHDAECAHAESLLQSDGDAYAQQFALEDLEAQDPAEWLATTPLMRALAARLTDQ